MALIGCLFATAVQISRYMSSTVWIFASTTPIPPSRYRSHAISSPSIVYNTVVLGRDLGDVYIAGHSGRTCSRENSLRFLAVIRAIERYHVPPGAALSCRR